MIEYRQASQADLGEALGWAAAEGWNPGLDDAAAFFAADPHGFFVATSRKRPVAAISVVNHTDSFAFLGLYLVRPAFRGRGIGFGLWTHALAHAGERTVGLDGVPDQQDNYRASGFVHAGATKRFTGAPTAQIPVAHPCDPGDIHRLIEREAAMSGTRKAKYLTEWFQDTGTRQTLVVRDGRDVVAFCTVRQCRDGAKIGPLWAADLDVAERLIAQAASIFPGPVSIDVPETSAGLAALCASLGMVVGFETARMYRGPYAPPPAGVFAVTTLELG